MSRIVSFYLGEIPDDFGRRIEEIWSFTDDDLEEVHDYIQRLFPLPTPSQFQPAPLLDQDTIQAFHTRPELRERLLISLDRMLRFYGLRREGQQVVQAEDFASKAENWLTPCNHNFLRITRILTALRLLGLPEWSKAFLAALEEIYQQHSQCIGPTTREYWRAAVE